ncbi:MAG: hypothetical protein EB830_03310 [Nitrosopumilus sp. H13]|nr:MAG: hypothetical protein EB830_03310 [Nitrosopumilus sp. H13]
MKETIKSQRRPHAGTRRTNVTAPGTPKYKSEWIVLVCSIVPGLFGFQGIAHIYVGRVRRGLLLLFGNMGIYFLGMFFIIFNAFGGDSLFPGTITDGLWTGIFFGSIYLGLLIIQIWDSRRLCRTYNKHVRKNNTAPW